MQRLVARSLILMGLLAVAGCGNESVTGEAKVVASQAQVSTLESGLGDLSMAGLGAEPDLTPQLSVQSIGDDSHNNTVISAFDLAQALAMVGWGSRGETALEMASSLGLPADVRYWPSLFESIRTRLTNDQTLSFNASHLWGQSDYPFLAAYTHALSDGYGATMTPSDFRSDLIGETFEAVGEWARYDSLGLLAAERFSWGDSPVYTRIIAGSRLGVDLSFPAESLSVQDGVFVGFDGDYRRLPMLRFSGELESVETDILRAVSLPLSQADVNALVLVLMPKPGSFGVVVKDLQAQVSTTLAQLQPVSGEWWLPAFSLSEQAGRRSLLTSRGIVAAFDKQGADFSAINGDGYLYLDDTDQRIQWRLTQEGVQASSVTLVRARATLDEPYFSGGSGGFDYSGAFISQQILPVCLENPPVANAHPFIVLVLERSTGMPLLGSKLVNVSGVEFGADYLGKTEGCRRVITNSFELPIQSAELQSSNL